MLQKLPANLCFNRGRQRRRTGYVVRFRGLTRLRALLKRELECLHEVAMFAKPMELSSDGGGNETLASGTHVPAHNSHRRYELLELLALEQFTTMRSSLLEPTDEINAQGRTRRTGCNTMTRGQFDERNTLAPLHGLTSVSHDPHEVAPLPTIRERQGTHHGGIGAHRIRSPERFIENARNWNAGSDRESAEYAEVRQSATFASQPLEEERRHANNARDLCEGRRRAGLARMVDGAIQSEVLSRLRGSRNVGDLGGKLLER